MNGKLCTEGCYYSLYTPCTNILNILWIDGLFVLEKQLKIYSVPFHTFMKYAGIIWLTKNKMNSLTCNYKIEGKKDYRMFKWSNDTFFFSFFKSYESTE